MKKSNTKTKRVLAIFLAVMMCVSMLNLTAFAEEGQNSDGTTLPTETGATPTPEATVVIEPTATPTETPSTEPTALPSEGGEPTEAPATDPTAEPTEEVEPTTPPADDPTTAPSNPEESPETQPTEAPAKKPAKAPVKASAAPAAEENNEAVCICTKSCQYFKEGFLEADGINHNCPVCDGDGWKTHCKGEDLIIGGNPSHEHVFGFWGAGTVKANCQMPEAWAFECDKPGSGCGAKLIIAFKPGSTPGPHQFNSVEQVDPTCTVDGHKTGVCDGCGKEVVEVIPATGHQLGEDAVVIPATCIMDGSKTGICTVCGEEVTEVIPALGQHTEPDEGVETQEPTCTEQGHKTYTCSVCGEAVKEDIPATGHSFVGTKCQHCDAVRYSVGTNDEWGTDIRDSWSHVFSYLVKEPDGTYHGYSDPKLTKPLEGGITVTVNHGTMNNMGIDRVVTDEDGNTYISTVKGWRNSKDLDGKLYQEGDVIPFEEAFAMGTSKSSTIWLDAVREKISAAVTPSGNEAGSIKPIEKIPAKIKCTDGITVKCTNLDTMEYKNGRWVVDITITVDSSFVPGDGHVDFSEALSDMGDIISDTMQPGDEIVLNIYLDNQSGYELKYKSNSGFIATEVRSTDGTIAGVGFDGNSLAPEDGQGKSFAPRRIYNDALKAIVTSTAGDAEIGAALRALGYGKGLANDVEITRNCLDDYYLDWTNAARLRNDPNATLATSLQDLTITELSKFTDGDKGNLPVETCQNVYEAFYYLFFGKVFQYNGVDIYEQMRQYSEGGNNEMDKNIPLLLTSPTTPYVLNIASLAGEEMNNGFQNIAFGFRLGFDLTAVPETPPVIILPTPTPTPTATPTPTPEPTEEPSPSPTPDPDDEIPDPDVPLGTPEPVPTPTPDPDDEIPDPDVPLGTPKPEQPTPTPIPTTKPTPVPDEEIPDEDVPKGNVPKTGDDSAVWFLLTLVSGAGLVFLGADQWKKRKGA